MLESILFGFMTRYGIYVIHGINVINVIYVINVINVIHVINVIYVIYVINAIYVIYVIYVGGLILHNPHRGGHNINIPPAWGFHTEHVQIFMSMHMCVDGFGTRYV